MSLDTILACTKVRNVSCRVGNTASIHRYCIIRSILCATSSLCFRHAASGGDAINTYMLTYKEFCLPRLLKAVTIVALVSPQKSIISWIKDLWCQRPCMPGVRSFRVHRQSLINGDGLFRRRSSIGFGFDSRHMRVVPGCDPWYKGSYQTF